MQSMEDLLLHTGVEAVAMPHVEGEIEPQLGAIATSELVAGDHIAADIARSTPAPEMTRRSMRTTFLELSATETTGGYEKNYLMADIISFSRDVRVWGDESEDRQRTAARMIASCDRLILDRMKVDINVVAYPFIRANPKREELIKSSAQIGLFEAVKRFDLEAGKPFSAFAKATMTGVIQHAIRDEMVSTSPLSRTHWETHTKVRKALDKKFAAGDHTATITDVIHELELDVEKTEKILAEFDLFHSSSVSLDATTPEGDGRIGDIVSHPEGEMGLRSVEDLIELTQALQNAGLDERDKIIMRVLYGVTITDEGVFIDPLHKKPSQEELAEVLETSQSYTSRIVRKLGDKVRKATNK